MKIEDAGHAVRVLEALVEQGDKTILEASTGPWFIECNGWLSQRLPGPSAKGLGAAVTDEELSKGDGNLIAASRSLVPALVEGAKAVLDRYRTTKMGIGNDPLSARLQEAEFNIFYLAKAYAPRMAEAGMKVPE